MRNLARFLLLLNILLIGTQSIVMPGIPLSLFQISLILAVAVALPVILSGNGMKKGSYLTLSLIWAISSGIAYSTSINPGWDKSYLLLGLMTSVLLFITPNLFDRSDIPLLEKTLIRSQYIAIPFSIFCYLVFYAIGSYPEEIPLFGGAYIPLGEDELARGTAAGEVRLMLPYSTPPILSIVMAMCITLLLFSKDIFKPYVKIIILIAYTVILLLTGSRSGIMGIVLLLIILLVCGDLKKVLKRIPIGWLLFIIVLIVSVVLLFSDNEYIQKMIISRFSKVGEEPIEEDRHLMVPIDGLLLWLDSPKNFLLGIGFGSSFYMQGAHTYLPPYFLNIYVTLIAERGLLGLVIVIMLISNAVRLFNSRKTMNDNERAFVYSLIVGLLSSIFYESLNSYYLIYVLVASYILRGRVNSMSQV